jgi:hypothetical protein
VRSHIDSARCAITAALLALLTLVVAQPSVAQRGPRAAKPTGAEIASKARSARLDRANAGQGQFQGKSITFTPAALPPRVDLAAGQVIGTLENDVAGDETGLPPGKYDVFAARLADGWHVYAESGGQIVKEALNVQIVRRPGQPADKRPRIRSKGWGVDIDYTPVRTFVPPPVASVSIVGGTWPALIGELRPFTIELRDAQGDLLSGRSVAWSSNTPSVASAPYFGIAKAVAGGTATLTATSEGKTASVSLPVASLSYQVTTSYPSNYNFATGAMEVPAASIATAQSNIYVNGCAPGACPTVLPNEPVATVNNPAIATVTYIGGTTGWSYASSFWQVKGLTQGTTDVTFSWRGASAKMKITVTRARAASLTITPTAPKVVVGQSLQLGGTLRDASGALVTMPITWSSANPSIADVTSTGRVAGVAVGSATITARGDSIGAMVNVMVAPVPVATVAVSPAPVSVEENQWTALTATTKDRAGNVLTGRTVIWTVNNPAIAEVTASGRVIGVAPGTAIVTATSEGILGSAVVTVTAAPPTATATETLSFNW